MRRLTRRDFLKTSTAVAVGTGSPRFDGAGARHWGSPASDAASLSPAPFAATEIRSGNLIANGHFLNGSVGSLPVGWTLVVGNPALKPSFNLVASERGRALMAEGNGRGQCYGYVRYPVRLMGGKTYRMQVKFHFAGFEDVNRHLVHGVFTRKFNNGIFQYTREGNTALGEGRFAGPAQDEEGEVRLYFRYSARGKVWWEWVSLEECQPIRPRPVKVAVSWGKGDLDHWSRWLDAAGRRGADIALMPELFNGVTDPMKAEREGGASWRLMADKARQWKMHVSGTTYVRRGELVLNSAPLFDRTGKLLGVYDKNMVYEPELDLGASPGEGFPVFETDAGRIGTIICYDSWFPETVRMLALKGAELILFPNEGYYMELMHARSADNGVFIAASSGDNPAGVWDSGGNQAGEARPDPTCYAPSTILGFRKDEARRLFLVAIDLSKRTSPAWWGGPMRSAPGGRRCRETSMDPLEGRIGQEAARWFGV